jgi:hypothetical protein
LRINEKRFCADRSLTLQSSVGDENGAAFHDGEGGRVTLDLDESKTTACRVRAVLKNSVERLVHQPIEAIE